MFPEDERRAFDGIFAGCEQMPAPPRVDPYARGRVADARAAVIGAAFRRGIIDRREYGDAMRVAGLWWGDTDPHITDWTTDIEFQTLENGLALVAPTQESVDAIAAYREEYAGE